MGNYLQLLYHCTDNSVIYANRRREGRSLQITQINLVFAINFTLTPTILRFAGSSKICLCWSFVGISRLLWAWKDRGEGEAGQLTVVESREEEK